MCVCVGGGGGLKREGRGDIRHKCVWWCCYGCMCVCGGRVYEGRGRVA
jgi:hypothetical protein